MSLIPVGQGSKKSGYDIPKALRLRSVASAYLTKTPTSVGTSRRRFTWSGWVKRGNVAQITSLFGTSDSGAASGYGTTYLGFLASGALRFVTSRISDGLTFIYFDTTAVFLDPTAHYHVQVAIDIDQAVNTNGCRIWVNNTLLAGTHVVTYSSGNDMFANHTVPQYVGRTGSISPSGYVDGFMSEVNMIDGLALDPSHFGKYDTNNVWVAKKFTGVYGINGYYLPFTHGTALAELGFDCKTNSFREVAVAGIVGSSLTTADMPFGASSLSVNGAFGSYVLYTADGRNTIGNGQYCLRCWFKDTGKVAPPATNSQNTIFSQGDNAGNAMWRLLVDNASRQMSWGFTGAVVIVSATYPVSTGVWHEVVITRNAANFERIFLDGRLVSTRTNTTNFNAASGSYVHLGSSYDTNYPGVHGVSARHSVLNGFIKEVSFTTGYILDDYQTSETVVGTQVWTPKLRALVTDAKTNKGWAYTGFYVPAEGTNGSTAVPQIWQHHFTPTNVSITAGVTYDWMEDTPTDNAPTLSSLMHGGTSSAPPLGNANLAHLEATGAATWKSRLATMAIPLTGKWYAEFAVTYSGSNSYTAASAAMIGLHDGVPSTLYIGATATTYGFNAIGGKYNNGVLVSGLGAWTNNCIIMVAYDATAGMVWFGRDGTWVGSGNPATGANPAYSGISGEKFFATGGYWVSPDGDLRIYPNFGSQRPFTYTPPTGFLSLRGKNLPNPAIPNGRMHFDQYLYVGDGTNGRVLTFPNFDPDFIWFKQRSTAVSNYTNDRIRGNDKILITNLTNVESAFTGYFSWGALSTKQVTISYTGSGGNDFGYNQNTYNYIAWLWKAGNAAVANAVGSIATQVSANPQAGFSVVTYTGNSTAGATIGHGLGLVPHFVIIKARSQTTNWHVYHKNVPNTQYLKLSLTDVAQTAAVWNNTTPTSTVVTLGGVSMGVNNNAETYVAYVFSEIPGYSKFGSYVGTGSADGPFVYCGFRPQYILYKRVNVGAANWVVIDTKRNPHNPANLYLIPNLSDAEGSASILRVVANGFKLISATAGSNGSGDSIVYAAFAEHPFKHSRAF